MPPQTKNAMALVNKKAAVLVRDKEASEKMLTTAFEVIDNQELMDSFRKNILGLAKPNAAKDIARVVVEQAQK